MSCSGLEFGRFTLKIKIAYKNGAGYILVLKEQHNKLDYLR